MRAVRQVQPRRRLGAQPRPAPAVDGNLEAIDSGTGVGGGPGKGNIVARGMSGSWDRRERWRRFIDSNRQRLGGLRPTGLVRRGELDRVDAGAQGERIAVRSPGPCADPVGQDVDTARGIGRLQGNYDRGPIPTMVAPFSRKYRGGLRRGRVDRDYDRSTPRHVSGGIGGAIAHSMNYATQRQGPCTLGPPPTLDNTHQPRKAGPPSPPPHTPSTPA